ncbi:phosphonopyruvate decarboxylase [Gemmatimonadota bacterium]
MINPSEFYDALSDIGISFFTGVPDSTLKYFCSYVEDSVPPEEHVITSNEGLAVALASGYFLATGRTPLVYMQNSGFGNALNPLISLAAEEVYSIPMLLLIGWRGEPGVKDEPQHIKQGRIQQALMNAADIPWRLVPSDMDECREVLKQAVTVMKERNCPVALLMRKGIFESYKSQTLHVDTLQVTRETAIERLVDRLGSDDIVVSTTGKTSRELFEYREELKAGHDRDFLTVGSMGHCSHIALGIAMMKPDRRVICLDGDGAVLMHMGALATIGTRTPENLRHIIINNGAHESVGGQPTVGFEIDLPAIARANGYGLVLRAESIGEIEEALDQILSSPGPSLLEIRVALGSRADLGRPTLTPIENRDNFMRFLQK